MWRPSVCHKHFVQIASSTIEMAGASPNLHTIVPRRARIQGVLKVKVRGHVIGTLLWFHENRFFSQANGWITTKLAHNGPQKSPHPGCAQGQGQRSRHMDTFVISRKLLLLACKWLERYQTWFPARPASRVCYGHFCYVTKCLLYSTVSRCLYVRSLYEAPLYSPSSISKYHAARSNV